MPTVYPPLSMGAPARLALFKREAARPCWVRPMTWRDVRFATLKSSPGLDQGFDGETPIWYTQSGAEFRNERYCDDIGVRGIDHRGWFTDDMQDEKVRGIVASLPHGRFLAGYITSVNDERVYFPDIFDDEKDAARMADEHARIAADNEREWRERDDAEQREAEQREREQEEAEDEERAALAEVQAAPLQATETR